MQDRPAIDAAAPPPKPGDLVTSLAEAGGAKDSGRLTIRQMSRQFGLTARALRFYEERGLIEPERDGGDRLYSRRDRARLRLVMMGKSVGFSLDEIKSMLDLYDLGDGGVTQLKVARGKFREQIGRLERRRAHIDAAIGEIERACAHVDALLAERIAAGGANHFDDACRARTRGPEGE